ncbi:hypothetical protein ACQKKX_04485 [Neorhizobium sp. NPDC001467]|uniref:hypothetical protein n=1 Tax=Neorhizobium sp. NPDC001467 TaxID=3390595 RepID=UPI003CFD2F22
MYVPYISAEDHFERYDSVPAEDKRPLPECPDYIAIEFSPHEAIGVPFASYNSDIDDDILNVMRGVRDGLFCTDIAEKHGMSRTHVELIQAILCGAELANYGTSPRGSFVNLDSKDIFHRLLGYWERLQAADYDENEAGDP